MDLVHASLAVGKIIYGFVTGLAIWFILVAPYLRYYDFTLGSYWPSILLAITIALVSYWSDAFVSLMVLYLPSMIGGATQNYVLMLIFTSILLNPVTNIGLNAVESVRVIGCSLTMTFNQLRERTRLILNPILEVLSDTNQTALDPIRKNLFEIQQFVGKLQRNINSAVIETTKLGSDATSESKSTSGDSSIRDEPQNSRYGRPVNHDIESSAQSAVEWDWDLENFGLKASVNVDQLRALARRGHLKKFLLMGNETLATQQMNITDILYDSCRSMFKAAKDRCSEAVNDMHVRCKNKLGPLLSAFWCEPFTLSLDAFCPTIMNQVVNEQNVCQELKLTQIRHLVEGRKYISNSATNTTDKAKRFTDVNEAFRELTRQIVQLNKNILPQEGEGNDRDGITVVNETLIGGGSGGSDVVSSDRLRRFELSLTFNEKTRQIFLDIKQLIAFIGNKYKMRKLFIDLLLLLYDIYTTYTFVIILTEAWSYRRAYLSDIKFDNCYITREFIEYDRQRSMMNELESAASAGARSSDSGRTASKNDDPNDGPERENATRMTVRSKAVLPLTKDESERYISPFACCRRTKAERRHRRASCWSFIVLLVLALSVLYLDNIFHSILVSIEEHSLIRYKEVGHHELDIQVHGDGVMAQLVKRLVANFNSVYKLNRLTSTKKCLPQASHTTGSFYLNFAYLMTIYFLIDELTTYAKRLRPITCSLFYPDMEFKRTKYLHRFIRLQRKNLKQTGVKSYLVSGGGSIKNQDDVLEEELDEMDEEQAFSLAEAAVYLRDCLTRSAQNYCTCWGRHLFTKPSSTVVVDHEPLLAAGSIDGEIEGDEQSEEDPIRTVNYS